ncbi:minor capsid protein [Enterococcus faecalis]|uniref:minor capsid protein n=1 Tax=Enterococcus faecalis TaxID=1351 RepID=UPI003B6730D2
MDFLDCLNEKINQISNLPLNIRKGYLSALESLVIYPLPGGKVETEYYDGIKDELLNYEIAMKSKDGGKIEHTLWLLSDILENIEELPSKDSSFEYNNLTITNRPFINEADEQSWFVFLLDFQAKLTTFKGEK